MNHAAPYDVRPETPSVAAFRHLRVATGLSPKSAAVGLAGTWYAVTVCHNEEPVGMAHRF